MANLEITLPTRVVQIPLRLNDLFEPTDLEDALDYYPTYRALGGPWNFPGYLSWILKQIDRAKPQGYTGQQAFDGFVAWLGGLSEFMLQYLAKYHTFDQFWEASKPAAKGSLTGQ